MHRLPQLAAACMFTSSVLAALTIALALPPAAYAANSPEPTTEASATTPITWLHDYQSGMQLATEQQQMLLVWFTHPKHEAAERRFAEQVLAQPAIAARLGKLVAVQLPIDTQVTIAGQPQRLLSHAAFTEMENGVGLAMIDCRDKASPHFRRVVSVYPFGKQYISAAHLATLLDLPTGTLTQRTLTFAVRTHPLHPQSASCKLSGLLAKETEKHSRHQASIRLQGHHNWDQRFQTITAALPGDLVASEVCAESWPNEGLLVAAIDCVDCWRQSSGHWEAVSGRHELFAYDMQRGSNGIWYATGIFGSRR